jgi:hypothetical protein
VREPHRPSVPVSLPRRTSACITVEGAERPAAQRPSPAERQRLVRERMKRGRTAALSKSTSSELVGTAPQRVGGHGVPRPGSTMAKCASYRGTYPPTDRPKFADHKWDAERAALACDPCPAALPHVLRY